MIHNHFNITLKIFRNQIEHLLFHKYNLQEIQLTFDAKDMEILEDNLLYR